MPVSFKTSLSPTGKTEAFPFDLSALEHSKLLVKRSKSLNAKENALSGKSDRTLLFRQDREKIAILKLPEAFSISDEYVLVSVLEDILQRRLKHQHLLHGDHHAVSRVEDAAHGWIVAPSGLEVELRLTAPLARHRHHRLNGQAFFHHSAVDKTPVISKRKIGDHLRNRIRPNKRPGR